MNTHRIALALAVTSLPLASQAGELYTSVGLPGVLVGWAEPISPRFTLRADVGTLGRIGRDSIEEGVSYAGTLRSDRAAFLMDWFVLGGMRLTGGITFNRMRVDLRANGNGGNITIGDSTVPTSTADRFDVSIRFPSTTPYLGIGYGHQLGAGTTVLFDLGGSIGRPTLSESHSGPNLGSVPQSEVDKELAQLRDGIGRVRVVPQLSLGVNVQF